MSSCCLFQTYSALRPLFFLSLSQSSTRFLPSRRRPSSVVNSGSLATFGSQCLLPPPSTTFQSRRTISYLVGIIQSHRRGSCRTGVASVVNSGSLATLGSLVLYLLLSALPATTKIYTRLPKDVVHHIIVQAPLRYKRAISSLFLE